MAIGFVGFEDDVLCVVTPSFSETPSGRRKRVTTPSLCCPTSSWCPWAASAQTHVLRVVCWTDQSPCTSLSCSGPLHILQRTRAWVWIRACFSCPNLPSGSRTRQTTSSRARHSCSSAAAAAVATCLMVSGHVSTQTRLY